MFNFKIRHLVVLTATTTLLFSQNALAATGIDSIGTGSSGSYSYGKSKGEGSKSKKMPHISGSSKHHKKEGSGKKSYSHSSKHGYSHKKPEGSSSKHHAKSGHGHGKKSYSHSSKHGYSHKKSEESSSKHHAKSGHGHGKKSGHGGHSSKCPFTHLLKFKDKLGLTEAQVAEIKRLRFEYRKQSIRNKAEHKIAHMDFDRLVHEAKVDAQAIRSAAGKIAKIKTQEIIATAEAKIALLNLLTDEQRKKAQTMHSAHSHH